MNKGLAFVFCLFLMQFSVFSQKNDRIHSEWKQLREENVFQKNSKYSGPSKLPYVSPIDLTQQTFRKNGFGSSYSSTTTYNGQPLKVKQVSAGKTVTGGTGADTVAVDPEVDPAEDFEIPEIDEPDLPDVDLNVDVDLPSTPWEFWQIAGIILIILVLAFVIYQLVKNYNPPQGKDKKLTFEAINEDMNPVLIPKSELELRLEEALLNGNYKECVRIYFLFAMKYLIQEKRISWKKEKTNIDYMIEMLGKPGVHEFKKMVEIYDIVWYGDYEINEAEYTGIAPKLKLNYELIEQSK